MRRFLLAVIASCVLLTALPAVAAAQDEPDPEPTSGITLSEDIPRISSLPRPDPNARPLRDTDPGGWQQLTLFLFVLLGMGGVALLAGRDVAKAKANRAALATTAVGSGGGLQAGPKTIDDLDGTRR